MKPPDIIVPAKPKPVEVPLTLKGLPALIKRHRTKEPDDIIDLIERTAVDLQQAAEQLANSHAKIMGNQLAPPMHNAISARRVLGQHSHTALVKFDKARAHVEAAISKLEAETLPRPQKDQLGVIAELQASEIRSVLRSMKPNERLKAANDAVLAGDEGFTYACINGMPHLTGLSGTEVGLIRDFWQRHWHSETMERTGRLKAALSDLDRGGTLYGTFSGGIDVDLKASTAAAEELAKLAASVT